MDTELAMPAILRFEEWDVELRLAEFDLTKEQLLGAVHAAVAHHGGCTDNDPPNARGWEVWRWGVRRLRELLPSERWKKDDTGGYSTIVNDKRRIRIAVLNTDDATGILGDRFPQNRCRKGPTSERAATANQQILLFPFPPSGPPIDPAGYATWHLCIYIDGDEVRAELSLMNDFEGGSFTDCHERIILIGPDDWSRVEVDDDSDLGPEFEPQVERR